MKKFLDKFSGSVVYAYVMCPRQGWFMFHDMLPEQDNFKLAEGRNIHEFTKQSRGHKEYVSRGIRVDRVEKHGGKVWIYEVKNSTCGYEAAKMQMLFYLSKLKMDGVDAIGVIEVPRKNKQYTVRLDRSSEKQLLALLEVMDKTLSSESPPPVYKKRICKWCGYRNICFA